jgi:serine/threonine-protein kinase RsbW
VGEVRLEIPARAQYLGLARQVVAAAAAMEPTFRDERIDALRIAVSEATTNAIEAHTDLDQGERIVIRCNLGADQIEVEVVDRGAGFGSDTPDMPPMPDPTASDRLDQEHGLGLSLMRVLADEAEIRSGEGGTAVRLVVYRTPRP